MLKMDQYELIKTAHRVYGKSIRAIAREYGHSRKTVRKVLREVSPRYTRDQGCSCPVMDPHRSVILNWLRSDQEMPKKQRHTARRVYTRLVKEYDFRGAESTVRRFVRQLKVSEGLSKREAFVPLEADVGQEAEVDWGKAVARIAGERRDVQLFCMRSKYSGQDFVRAYPQSRQEMFFDGHIRAFHYYGGVFPTLIYDNLTSAVLKILTGRQRIEQEAFRRFRSYYTFESRFCNPGKGHEKGGVEGLVGYARRNYLVPLPEVDSFDELNELLLSSCIASNRRTISGRDEPIAALFEAERQFLLVLPAAPYPVKQLISSVVSHYSTVRVDHNRYSVPTDYVGYNVEVELMVEHVVIYHNRRRIAAHERLFGKNKWQLDPFHYLKLLFHKPGAFEAARPIRQWRCSWPAAYEQLLSHLRFKNGHSGGTKAFLAVLMLSTDYPKELFERALEEAVRLSLSDAASVQSLLNHWLSEQAPQERLSMEEHPKLAGFEVAPPDLQPYGTLLESAGKGGVR